MNSATVQQTSELLQIVADLSSVQRRILINLHNRGPALLLEMAVRLFAFPDEIRQPVQDLRAKGLIRGDSFSGWALGGEIFSLTRQGRLAVELLEEETALRALQSRGMAHNGRTASDPRQQEVDLLCRLGDLAIQMGDTDEARRYYKEALEVTRSMNATPQRQ